MSSWRILPCGCIGYRFNLNWVMISERIALMIAWLAGDTHPSLLGTDREQTEM
jgi:hypothetical protein